MLARMSRTASAGSTGSTTSPWRKAALAAAALGAAAALLAPLTPAAAQIRGRYTGDGYGNNANDAAVAAARAQVQAARQRVEAVIRAKRAEFAAKPETIEDKRKADAADAAWQTERQRVVVGLKESNPDYARLSDRAEALQAELDEKTPGAGMSAGAGTATPSGASGVSTGGDGSGAAAALADDQTPEPEHLTPATQPGVIAEENQATPRGTGGPATRPDDPDAAPFDLDKALAQDKAQGKTATVAPPEQVAQAAEVLELKQTMDAMEDAAILKDEKAVAAKNAYDAAAAQTSLQSTKLRADLLNDPEYKQAQQQLETGPDAARRRVGLRPVRRI